MFERFVKSCGNSPKVRDCLESYVQGDYLSTIKTAFEALQAPPGGGFELVLIALLSMQAQGLESGAERLGEEALTSPRYPEWDKILVRIVLGRQTPENALRDVPQTSDNPLTAAVGMPADSANRRCQANYYHGARLMKTEDPEFHRYLREAILSGAVGMLEFELAIAQLEKGVTDQWDLAYACLGRGYLDLVLRRDATQARSAEALFAQLGGHRELRAVRGLLARLNEGGSPGDREKGAGSQAGDKVSIAQDSPAAIRRPVVVKTNEGSVAPAPREVITNSIGMKMAVLPAGEFLMGWGDSDDFPRPDGRPQHRVRLTKAFCVGVYPVTQAEYKQVMGRNPSHFVDDGPTAPVESISWEDAQEFCRKLSALPTEQEAGHTYRLLTEAEWEFACRAGTQTQFSFGGDPFDNLGEYAWYSANSQSRTHPVGQKRPNAWGLYDMHGNVFEWCADWYRSDYYAQSPIDDPTGPDSGVFRVLRCSSWGSAPVKVRCACRGYNFPDRPAPDLGFRVARTLAP